MYSHTSLSVLCVYKGIFRTYVVFKVETVLTYKLIYLIKNRKKKMQAKKAQPKITGKKPRKFEFCMKFRAEVCSTTSLFSL